MASPDTDLMLLGLTAIDVQRGALATQVHAIAAVYLGFAAGFGHRVVQATDRHFTHRFAAGPAPVKSLKRARRGSATNGASSAGALLGCLSIVTVVLANWVPDRTSAGGLLGEVAAPGTATSPQPAHRHSERSPRDSAR